MRLDFFAHLKCESCTIMLSVGDKYSVRDLLFDFMNNALPIAICVTCGISCQRSLSVSVSGINHSHASTRLGKFKFHA